MSENEVVRARIDGRIKSEAAAVLAAMGLTVSDAFRLLMTRVAVEKALPFAPLVPNTETVKAMKAARRGEMTTARSSKELFEDLRCRRLGIRSDSSGIISARNQGIMVKSFQAMLGEVLDILADNKSFPHRYFDHALQANGVITAIATLSPIWS